MARVLTIVGCVLLGGCAATQVHLFTESVPTHELEIVTQKLRGQGYQVYLNELEPPNVKYPTLIYNPAHRDINDVVRLSDLVSSLGYPEIKMIPAHRGNHVFTGSNVGLYLGYQPTPPELSPMAQLAKEFTGICDDVDAYLNLNENGGYELEWIEWDEADTTSINVGSWRLVDDTVSIAFAGRETHYAVEKSTRADLPISSQTTKLIANDSENALRGCNFVYTQAIE